MTALMVRFAEPLFYTQPLLAAVLIGIEVAGIAWIWQIVYDRYWGQE